jgi:16S rRNA (guanine527-N7)-methyltransferase
MGIETVSTVSSEGPVPAAARLNTLLIEAGLDPLDNGQANRFGDYLALLLRWNARMNLTAVRDEGGILSRHFVESIACALALPVGIATLLDFGSGAGFPGIPIALCRPDIAVTLAESQGKKAAFLREAVRTLGLSSEIQSGRAESLNARFDCVILRAVDRMPKAVRNASSLLALGGWLALMTTLAELESLRSVLDDIFDWQVPILLPGSESRLFVLAQLRVKL